MNLKSQSSFFGSLGICLLGFFAVSATASSLDDQIHAFKDAPTQAEAAVSQILQSGLKENRSAQAFAAVKPWLTANASSSQQVLFQAAQVAERASDWPAAVSFYRKLSKNPSIDSQLAAAAVPMAYRLLINHLGDPEGAYLFMREDGDRLRVHGRARQFDGWFIKEAKKRNDIPALCGRLAALCRDNSVDIATCTDEFEWVCAKLEAFKIEDESWYPAALALSKAPRVPAIYQARIEWVAVVMPYNRNLDTAREGKLTLNPRRTDASLAAAEQLLKTAPDRGAFLVAQGWGTDYDGANSGNSQKRLEAEGERKLAQLLAHLPRMSPGQRSALLKFPLAQGRVKFPPAAIRKLVVQFPEMFNSLSAIDVPLFDKSLTLQEAQALAPLLARNPNSQAALVRAFAAAGSNKLNDMLSAVMKSERWRFKSAKDAVDAVWNSGIAREGNHEKFVKEYANSGATYDQLSKQVAKQAAPGLRNAAFKTLSTELLGPDLTTPGLLFLWDDLFTNAPDQERVRMLIMLTADLQGDREQLIRRAGSKCAFQAQRYAGLFLGPDFIESWSNWGSQPTRKTLPEFATHVQGMLQQQMKAGTLSEPLLGMWLYSVEPSRQEALALMTELVASPAYAKVDPAYRQLASRREFFGARALPPESKSSDPNPVSKALSSLAEGSTPAQVEDAFKAVIARVSTAPTPVAAVALHKVVALSEWSAPTRNLAFSLFAENEPMGEYPMREGYEPLVRRLLEDAQATKQWGVIEPCVAGLWHAAAATDDERFYRGAEAMCQFAEAALVDAPSLALSLARAGLRSGAVKALSARNEPNLTQMKGKLRQIAGKAAVAIGAVEVPVDESDPAFSIRKSHAEFVQGNVDSAWSLYLANQAQLEPVLRTLTPDYGFWLLQRNIEMGRTIEAEELVKNLTIWAREAEGTFSPEQDARLKIAYADLAFRKGALPTSRAWYRKVADAKEYQGAAIYLEAALGSVKVDRVSKNFGSAMTELDKLMRLDNPDFRLRVHYARAEVFMDQENFKEALDSIDAVLRQQPKHADALILRGKIQFQMRKLVEASEIELGPSQDNTVIVPGEAIKINLRDPTLGVSGVGADIEVEIQAKSGDKERVLLYQLGDNKDKFRAEVPTALGPPVPGDKVLQVLGEDEIRFGYSERFRAKMKDLPPDPKVVISVASDAHLAFSAGAFPPREGERRLNIEELGLSTAQAALGTRTVRPGNPVYIRVTDPDRSTSTAVDEVNVSLQTSSGDEIRRLVLKETGPFTGEFQAVVPTTGAQALAFASESAPGRDSNMAISSNDHPGWQGNVGNKDAARTFGVDLNDNVALDKMTVDVGGAEQELTHFVLQTSMNGSDWTTLSRFPEDPAPWDGRPRVSSFPTYSGGIVITTPEGWELPKDWYEKMELTSARASIKYLSGNVKNLSAENLPVVETGHPGYSGLIQFRALFYQPAAAIRRFQLTGYPVADAASKVQTIFLIDGKPAGKEAADPLSIERELAPGLHEIQVWRNEERDALLKRKPVLLCDEPGQDKLIPCPDSMFDPAKFPEGVRVNIAQPAKINKSAEGVLDVAFGEHTRARIVRLVIQGFKGVAPTIKKVTLTSRDGKRLLPVAQDYMALRDNMQLEVLPGDQITVRYQDPVSATPKRNKHEQRLTVAFNDATLTASFLNYETTKDGARKLLLEPIRRFSFDDAVAIVVDDADMDTSAQRDTVDIKVTSSGGTAATIKALETEEHSGRFMGRVFPVPGKPSRPSEIQLEEGGTLTLTYRDTENLNPGIPTDRSATIAHAKYATARLAAYTVSSELLPSIETKQKPAAAKTEGKSRAIGPEIVPPRRTLNYAYVDKLPGAELKAVVGASLRFDVVAPNLALAGSSMINAYVQTDAGRKAMKDGAKQPFDVAVPGTLKLKGALAKSTVLAPGGYQIGKGPVSPTNEPPLEEGRFSFSIPLILGDRPDRSFATKASESLADSSMPEGLAVHAGDTVHIGYPYKDEKNQVQWQTAECKVGSHAFLDVMDGSYNQALTRAFVGEKIHVRLIDLGLDRGPARDLTSVSLKAGSGTTATYELQETDAHSGIFKGVFALNYASEKSPDPLPSVALNGFPVRYGDDLVVAYAASGENPQQSHAIKVNMGADGTIEPFSKRFSGDEMAVQTSFTLAECFFELAKKHRGMDQESLARREMAQARKLLAEAIATHRDDNLRAHAEYLLGNLAQEYADLSKNEEAKLPLYQDALARFSKIPSDYPDTDFAPKAQFKTALVYEKMGEIENAVEEYVKLAYKYPNNELISSVMSRLGGYFQQKGLDFKKQADALRDKKDDGSKAEVLRLDELSYPEFLNAAMVFRKLQERFPNDPLAGLSGLRAAQNFMRANQYEQAIRGFEAVIGNEEYDGREIRSQAIYWSGFSHERMAATMSKDNYKGIGASMDKAYQLYRRVTFDFPDSIWAKYARGRLADPAFEKIIAKETQERQQMIDSLKNMKKK